MEHTRSNKTIRVTIIFISILIVGVSTGLYLQGREISKLKKKLALNSVTEESMLTAGISPEQNLSQDDEEAYEKKIDKLETKLAEMKELSGYLEEDLNEHKVKDASKNSDSTQTDSSQKSKADDDFWMRRSFTDRHKEFFEEYEYPPEIKEKFIDLLIEKNNAAKKIFWGTPEPGAEKVEMDMDELKQQAEKFYAGYDEKIADLLSDDGLAALKEYEKYSSERNFLRDYKRMLVDDKLEREKEKKLLALMQDYTEIYNEENRKNAPSYESNGERPDKEIWNRLAREQNERTGKLYANYIEAAKGVLSESQMMKFEGYINRKKAYMDLSEENLSK